MLSAEIPLNSRLRRLTATTSDIFSWQVSSHIKKPLLMEISNFNSPPGTSHPYPDDTFYSVGRVPRKLLLKYLGIKMYLVRLKNPPAPKVDWGVANIAGLALASAGITSPLPRRPVPNRTK